MVSGIPGLGHNSEGAEGTTETVAAAELRQFVERVERLEEEKRAIADDIKDVYGEAKGRGYDTPTIRTLVRERRVDEQVRIEKETILETYRAALERAGIPTGSKKNR